MNKREVYQIWDDVKREICMAFVTEQELNVLGIVEHSGRFRYTCYGADYPYCLNKKQLEMFVKDEYKFEVGYYEFHLVDKNGKVIFNITDTMVDDDMISARENWCKEHRDDNMIPELLGYVSSMLFNAETNADNGKDFCGIVYDDENIERELAIWVIARGLYNQYEFY